MGKGHEVDVDTLGLDYNLPQVIANAICDIQSCVAIFINSVDVHMCNM